MGFDAYPLRSRLLSALLCLACLFMALPAPACTEDTVLDLVGRLEARGSYDTVNYRVKVRPPRAVTTMSVGEVLAWQRNTVRGGSISSAAGKYQIIRPTLQRLVDQGLVRPSETFDAATQDRLGRHLLRATGYRAGDTSPATANRIAGVWAALPRVSGAGAGHSIYEGVAGNHALITAPSYRAVLACERDVASLGGEIGAIRGGRAFGFHWDQVLEEIAQASQKVLAEIGIWAIGLLLGLFVIDLVLRAGNWILSGNPGVLYKGIAFRLLTVCLCLALLTMPGAFIDFIGAVVRQLAGSPGTGTAFSLNAFVSGRTALIFSLFEGLGIWPIAIQVGVIVIAALNLLPFALLPGLIVYWSARLLLAAAAGLFALGFGGLKETTAKARSATLLPVSAGLSLLVVMLLTGTTLEMAWTVRSETNPLFAAMSFLLLEITAAALAWLLPPAIGRIVR